MHWTASNRPAGRRGGASLVEHTETPEGTYSTRGLRDASASLPLAPLGPFGLDAPYEPWRHRVNGVIHQLRPPPADSSTAAPRRRPHARGVNGDRRYHPGRGSPPPPAPRRGRARRGWLAMRSLGPRVRVGRILASTPVVTVAEARAAASAATIATSASRAGSTASRSSRTPRIDRSCCDGPGSRRARVVAGDRSKTRRRSSRSRSAKASTRSPSTAMPSRTGWSSFRARASGSPATSAIVRPPACPPAPGPRDRRAAQRHRPCPRPRRARWRRQPARST